MKKMDKKGVAEIQNHQLLDNSSDFNNFENLAYFIGEYKKAKAIIAQCQSFYNNFLRTKLYSIQDLKKFRNINFIDLKLDTEAYAGHVTKLTKYILISNASKELDELSDVYGLKFFKYIKNDSGYNWNDVVNTWRIYPKKESLLGGNNIFAYLTDFIDSKYNSDIFSDSVRDGTTHFYDGQVCINYINENYANKHKIAKKFQQAYDCEYISNLKTGESRYELKPKKTEDGKEIGFMFYKLTNEEIKLIDFIKSYSKKYNYQKLYNDIYLNPEKYYDKWTEYIQFVSTNFKNIEDSCRYFGGVNYQKHIQEAKEEQKRKLIFCPAVYLKQTKHKNEDKHYYDNDYYEYFVTEDTCYIEAYKYLNKDYLKLYLDWTDDKNHGYKDDFIPKTYIKGKYYGEDVYIDSRCETFNTELFDYLAINIPQLLKVVKSGDNFTNIDFEKYHSYRLPNNYYFTIVNGTPFKFSNDLSAVKIKYEENKNILECTYESEYRKKKYSWPSDAPWVVTTYYYSLYFDCSTNEPIKYIYNKNTVEESRKYRY